MDCERWYAYWLQQLAYPPTNQQKWTWVTDCHSTLTLRGRPPLAPEERTWTAQQNHLPTQARADLEQLHRIAAGPPGPADIEANQPPAGRPCHISIRPDDLDQQTQTG